ncbi:MAG TPA: response regulator [Candidatus Polarisedimenticolia bacterium]|nr:response regulator [Candidatus Polarisedimenticolia bacterium]
MGSARRAQPEQGSVEKPDASTPEITERVLGYFRRNSEAMDSVEGIARFWVHGDRSAVEHAVADLHRQGLLDRRLIGGTAFYSLHRDTAPAIVHAAAASSAFGDAGPSSPWVPEAPGRLLVIDDDVSVRQFLVAALTEKGHSVAAAENGARGIEIFRAHPCDLVLTDIRMPGMSGLEVLKTVKQLRPDAEVIVVTAHASLETAIQALRDGAYDLITKPLPELEALYRVVDRALEKRRLAEENRLLVGNLQSRNVELTETVARLAAVNEIGKATTGLLDTGGLYDSLVRLVAQHLKARRVSVLVSESDSDTMTLVASIGIPEEEGLKRTVRVGEGISGRVAATQSPLLVQDIEKTDLKTLRTGAKYSTASFMVTPLTVSYPIRYQRRRVGVINVSDKHSGEPFTEQDLEFLSTLASQMAVAIENARLVEEMEGGYLAALVGVISSMEERSPESRGHSARVAELASAVARQMGLPEERVEILVRAAALHELGRLAARPEEQERSGGGLYPGGEWFPVAVMATERLLAPIASLRPAREIILHSADWFDAAPAPFGGDRPSIPVETRILAVCEDFIRLSSGDGPDSRRLAFETIRKLSGRKHDPEAVAALARVVNGGRR